MGPVSDFTVDNVVLQDVPLAWYCAPIHAQNGAINLADFPIATYAKNTRPYRELRTAMFERFGPEISLFPSSSLSSCFRLVETGLCVGALPISVTQDMVDAGKLHAFDPGWRPEPLQFSASYLGEPKSHLFASAAKIARDVALATTDFQ